MLVSHESLTPFLEDFPTLYKEVPSFLADFPTLYKDKVQMYLAERLRKVKDKYLRYGVLLMQTLSGCKLQVFLVKSLEQTK